MTDLDAANAMAQVGGLAYGAIIGCTLQFRECLGRSIGGSNHRLQGTIQCLFMLYLGCNNLMSNTWGAASLGTADVWVRDSSFKFVGLVLIHVLTFVWCFLSAERISRWTTMLKGSSTTYVFIPMILTRCVLHLIFHDSVTNHLLFPKLVT